MNLDILGIGIAVTFAIIAISAVILYLSFRIKEIFREEKSFKVQFAKTFLMLGILFLAGGMFYFFATAMNPHTQNFSTVPNASISSANEQKGSVFLGVSYPKSINTEENYTIFFRVYNPSLKEIHNGTIKMIGLNLEGAKSNFNIESDRIFIRKIASGEISGYLQMKSPSYPVILQGQLIFQSQDTGAVSESINIGVIETSVELALNKTKVVPYLSELPTLISPVSYPSSSTSNSAPTPDQHPQKISLIIQLYSRLHHRHLNHPL